MKKFLLALLLVVFVLSVGLLVACQQPNPDDDDVPPATCDHLFVEGICLKCGETQSEYELPRGENEKQLVMYWKEKDPYYTDNDFWMWHDLAEGQAYEAHECAYGVKVVLNVPDTITQVGFIIRKDSALHTGSVWGNAGKVYDGDRYVTLTGDVTTVYLQDADPLLYTSADGGKTLTMIKEITKLSISSMKEIKYRLNAATTITETSQVQVLCDGQPVEYASLSSLGKKLVNGTITFNHELDLTKNYVVTITDANGTWGTKTALPMEVFDSEQFVSLYTYNGDDLGATVTDDGTVFKVWAPTASKVVLNLYSAGNDGTKTSFDMTLGNYGVWSYTAAGVGHGTYYTYTASTAAGVQEAVDPYAKSAGVNGERGMVVDFSESSVTPTDFATETYLDTIDTYTEAVIWEIHIRDFSNQLEQVSPQNRGKYLAFTETGLTNSSGLPVGVDYISNLGATHVHLMPTYDYKTVDETKLDTPQFNWGYDPQNYNVPEGSYSSNPYDGSVRVMEFRQMVQALHEQGIGVIMDVVYNHTYDGNSNLNKLVPNYYYRYKADGTPSAGSGCGNDTASERIMYRKYMVDSVVHWLTEYKLDGFRFDLMGLHDVETMQAIETAVHTINPKAVIYGEAWTMTTSAASGTVLANQTNIGKVTATPGSAGAIAVFNDALRDGARGSVFTATDTGYLGNPNSSNGKNVKFGLIGGAKDTSTGVSWNVTNGGVINYISAHDNHTLWDKLAINNASKSVADRLALNRLGAAIVMVAKGTPFMQAGEEILRSKPNADGELDEISHNSYNADDNRNNLKWSALTAGSDEVAMFNYYKGLIAMRKSNPVLTANSGVTINVTVDANGVIVAKYDGGDLGKVIVVINPTTNAISKTLDAGNWSLVADGTRAGPTELSSATGSVSVAKYSANVYFSK